jgi:hypothetical protein
MFSFVLADFGIEFDNIFAVEDGLPLISSWDADIFCGYAKLVAPIIRVVVVEFVAGFQDKLICLYIAIYITVVYATRFVIFPISWVN